jgi:guanosine-3',5'-bis(diphosphate) 3'-pyrophosphohydrolase
MLVRPQAVANIISTYGVTHVATLQAAILHDTVEDTDTTIEDIAAEFGEEVARIVNVCLGSYD